MALTLNGQPVHVVEDCGNGISLVCYQNAGDLQRRRLLGESDAEYAARIATHGLVHVATSRLIDEH